MTQPDAYTVAEVARRLSPVADDREQYRVLRWLQNVTNTGLLRPIGGRHAGRGVHRQYSDDEVHKAAVLLALADINLPGGQLEQVAEWLDDMLSVNDRTIDRIAPGRRRHGEKVMASLEEQLRIWDAAKRGDTCYLSITTLEDGRFHLALGPDAKINPEDRLSIVLNVARLFNDVA